MNPQARAGIDYLTECVTGRHKASYSVDYLQGYLHGLAKAEALTLAEADHILATLLALRASKAPS